MNPPDPDPIKIIRQEARRSRALWYLERFLFIPYIHGGNTALSGFDCSGLIHEVLQGVRIEERGFDSKADGLWNAWKKNEVQIPYAGCLVFWLKDGRAFHVAMMIDDQYFIGANGGNEKTMSKEEAAKINAMVRLDAISASNPARRFADPFKE